MLDNGIIIILGLLILIIGVINVYIYRRVLALERNMIQNSKILQTFMLNQISETHGNIVNSNTINPTSIFDDSRNINVDNSDEKIDVSDTEDESVEYNLIENSTIKVDESDLDDSDLENEDDSDEDSDNGSPGIIEISNSLGDNLDIDNIDIDDLLKTDIDVLDDYGTTKTIELVDSIDIKLLSNTNENNDDKEIGVDNLKTKKNLGKMKIDDLRVLAVTNSLVGNEESHKLKKAELLKLLQDN